MCGSNMNERERKGDTYAITIMYIKVVKFITLYLHV